MLFRSRLEAALSDLLPAASLGELFERLEPELRRPVEIFGLLHLAADRGWEAEEELEVLTAQRPDGTRRGFAVPRLPLPDPDLAGTPGTRTTAKREERP